MKISKKELSRPISKKINGGLATLKEVMEGEIIKKDLDLEDYRDLAIARYEMMNPKKAIVVGGIFFTQNQIIEEIKKRTEKGDRLVEMQVRFIRLLLDRKDELEAN